MLHSFILFREGSEIICKVFRRGIIFHLTYLFAKLSRLLTKCEDPIPVSDCIISVLDRLVLVLYEMFTFTGGYGYEPLPSTSTHNAMEDENERVTEELKDKIHALKSLSIDIGTEVKYQDKMLRSMVSESDF